VWQSQEFVIPRPTNFGCFQATGLGSVTFKFYCDGVLKHTKVASLSASPNVFRLPSGFVASKWSIRMEGDSNSMVTRLHVATSPLELQGVS
jgi:hypothetical protein